MRGATVVQCSSQQSGIIISIHAPLAGSDQTQCLHNLCRRDFNPRSPCGERLLRRSFQDSFSLFQSTLPLRGATPIGFRLNPVEIISIHAPLAGSDTENHYHNCHCNISIHAPLAGSDYIALGSALESTNFNPRSPCGERRVFFRASSIIRKFQSTLPLRGATSPRQSSVRPAAISIHAPLAGSDLLFHVRCLISCDFNPRSPCGERRYSPIRSPVYMNFNPRSPCGERRIFGGGGNGSGDFNPRSPCGERLQDYDVAMDRWKFQSTLPLRGATNGFKWARKTIPISIHAPLAGSDKYRVFIE